MRGWFKLPPWRRWPPLHKPWIDVPGAARAPYRECERCKDRSQQFPDPGRAPLRYPQATEVAKRDKGDRAREKIDDKQNSQSDLLVCPEEAGYEQARANWNAMVARRPGLIAPCADVADIRAVVPGVEPSLTGQRRSP